MAVDNDELRVHGLDELRVIDASVLPGGHLDQHNAPTIMIAEKVRGADQGRRGRQRLAA